MKTITGFFQKNLLICILFLTLFFCLFLGDGKQEIIDVVGLGLTLTLFVIARFFIHKHQEIPRLQLIAWFVFLVYITVRTVFSDDIGFSFFVMLRYYEAFLLYYIFLCYFTENTISVFNRLLLGFCVISLMSALAITCIPGASQNLPLMNLLFSTYGHNHIVDILLFGYSLALISMFQTKRPVYFWLTTLFFTGTIFAFARAALFFEAVLLNIGIIYTQMHNNKVHKATVFIGLVFMAITSIAYVFPYQAIQTSKLYLPKQTKQQDIVSPRFEFTKQALSAIKERPFFGSGPGTFSLLSKRYQNGPERYSWFAHNYIAETAAEIGLFGVALLGFVIFSVFRKTLRTQIISLAVLGAVFLYSFVDYSLNYLVVWFLFWSYLGLSRIYHSDKHIVIHRNPPTIIWISVVCIFLGYTVLLSAFLFVKSPTQLFLVQKANDAIQKNTELAKYAALFHKQNSETLLTLSHSNMVDNEEDKEKILFEAVSLDSQNIYMYNDLFQQLSKKEKYSTLWSLLQKTSCLTRTNNVCEKIQAILLSP